MATKKIKFKMLSAYTILFIIIFVLGILSTLIKNEVIVPANFSDILLAPLDGFKDAIEISMFVFVIGGFLGVLDKTCVMHKGISRVIKNMHGKEIYLIPILMIIFSIGGTTFGMWEETVAFYAIIVAAMSQAGFDSTVSAAIIIFGAGSGVLGSTINPFAISVAVDTACAAGVNINQGIVMLIGAILWIVTLLICIFSVVRFAKKTQRKDILSLSQKEGEYEKFETKDKVTLFLFALTFVVMILSLIPWQTFNIHIFDGWGKFLTGNSFGEWGYKDLSIWFVISAVLISFVFKIRESEFIKAFIKGASDMTGVVLVIAVSRGISVILKDTHLGDYILERSAMILKGTSPILFTFFAYIIYLGLSFLIPSTSGLATGSMGIFAPLAVNLSFPPEVMISIFSSAVGVLNLITPTSGVLMGGLSIAKIEYSRWVKFIYKTLLIIVAANLVILSLSMLILKI